MNNEIYKGMTIKLEKEDIPPVIPKMEIGVRRAPKELFI